MLRSQKPLAQLFQAMFHKKQSFEDFLSISVASEFKRHLVNTGRKEREVLIPSAKLRAYQQFLRVFVVDFLPIAESAVFSYRKGVSTREALEVHRQSKHFYTSDIQNFFPSLSRRIVQQTIQRASPALPVSDIATHMERILDLMCIDEALPVGFSTSPGISNAVLLPFDKDFLEQCGPRGLSYTRYADDIIVSAPERSAIDGVEELLAATLAGTFGAEMKLHPGKSKHLHVGGKVKLLGMVLLPNGHITVDIKVKQQVEAMLHFFLTNRAAFETFGGVMSTNNEARLAGLLNYTNTVDKDYLDKLRRKYGTTVVDLFLHRSFG